MDCGRIGAAGGLHLSRKAGTCFRKPLYQRHPNSRDEEPAQRTRWCYPLCRNAPARAVGAPTCLSRLFLAYTFFHIEVKGQRRGLVGGGDPEDERAHLAGVVAHPDPAGHGPKQPQDEEIASCRRQHHGANPGEAPVTGPQAHGQRPAPEHEARQRDCSAVWNAAQRGVAVRIGHEAAPTEPKLDRRPVGAAPPKPNAVQAPVDHNANEDGDGEPEEGARSERVRPRRRPPEKQVGTQRDGENPDRKPPTDELRLDHGHADEGRLRTVQAGRLRRNGRRVTHRKAPVLMKDRSGGENEYNQTRAVLDRGPGRNLFSSDWGRPPVAPTEILPQPAPDRAADKSPKPVGPGQLQEKQSVGPEPPSTRYWACPRP